PRDQTIRSPMSLEHPLVGADQVPRRLAEDGAPAILHSAPEVFVTPCPAPRRIVRRADDVREIEKRVTHRRQPFSVSPSDSTRELVPVTAKIAMRKSGPITTPVSLTSRNGESASLAEDGVSLASLPISGAAGSASAGGKRASGKRR